MSTNNRDNPGISGLPLALLLAATQMLAFSDRFLITLVAQPLKVDLDLSDAQLGILQGSAFALLNAAAMPWAGGIADRGHRRSLLMASVLAWSAATLLCGFAGSFAVMVAARALLGLGQAAVAPVALSLLAHHLPREKLGRAISLMTAGTSLGRTVALLAGGALLAWLSAASPLELLGYGAIRPWQALFVLACIPNVALLAGLWQVVEPPATPVRDGRPAYAWIMRHRATYLPHFGAAAATMLINQALTAWAPTFYVRVHGLTPAESGLRLGLVVLVAAPLGHLAGGHSLDWARTRMPRTAASRALALGLALTPICTAVMVLANSTLVSLIAFGALIAVLGFSSPAALAGLQFVTPRRFRGRTSAIFVAGVTLVAFGAGPVLIGVVNDRVVGPQHVGMAMLTVFGAAALFGIALALATCPLEPRRRGVNLT